MINKIRKDGSFKSKKEIEEETHKLLNLYRRENILLMDKLHNYREYIIPSKNKNIEELLGEINKMKEDYKKKLSEEILPSLFAEVGLSELKLADGRLISVKDYYGASIKPEKRAMAYAWLRNNGFGDLVKNQVSCSFGRNEDEKARGLLEHLNKEGYESLQREWVEPSTLRAFIREQHESGKKLPMDLLGAYVGQKTTIKS